MLTIDRMLCSTALGIATCRGHGATAWLWEKMGNKTSNLWVKNGETGISIARSESHG